MGQPKPRRFLDTHVLIADWHAPAEPQRPEDAVERARALIALQRTEYIASPVRVEFLAGAGNTKALQAREAYIDQFKLIDDRKIPAADWAEADRFAKHVGSGIRTRKLGDCLLQAIARRLNCDIVTSDRDIRRRSPPTLP